ncbi:MAG: TRAP transporter large permease [Peptococcaceae bacterium]|jgi:tripartite ATP-independent transporter DctM subunit|nr:TRAP transporter large permease [Peptococcaceae bacterium]MDH7523755.1 TRAP transporter large permease [Peptococcaceae bacterium]
MVIAAIVFAVSLIIGVPIAFVLGLLGTTHFLTLGEPSYFNVLIQRMFSQVNLLSLTCLPFFILAGEIMNAGGVTKRLLGFIREVIGWLKGGMAYSTVIIAAILSAILGSPNGVASMLCNVLIPDLRKDGYPDEFSGALVAASSILGPIIPPSIQFIMVCMLTDTSVKAMFLAGIVPGLLLAAVFCIVILYKAKKMEFKASIERINIINLFKAFFKAIPALMVPFVIMGGVIGGIFTATESGAISCLAAFAASLIYGELEIKKIPAMLMRASVVTGSIMLMIAFGGIIGWSMAIDGVPEKIIALITSITGNTNIIIAIMLAILFLAGMVMDTGSITMIFVPVMFPLALAIGMDPVHFGLVFSVYVIIGYITPPVGVVLFVTSNISGIPFKKLCSQIWMFAIGSMIVISVLSYLPEVVLWIPRMLGYNN